MHKERAVCSAVDDTILGRPAAVLEPINLLRPAHAFPRVSDALDCDNSQIDKIPKPKVRKAIRKPCRKPWLPRNPREIDRAAPMRGIFVLAA